MFSTTWRVTDFVFCIVSTDKVLHNTAALENTDLLAVIEGVCDSWNPVGQRDQRKVTPTRLYLNKCTARHSPTVWIDFGKPVRLLFTDGHVEFADVVR